jgi:hypothetical protein
MIIDTRSSFNIVRLMRRFRGRTLYSTAEAEEFPFVVSAKIWILFVFAKLFSFFVYTYVSKPTVSVALTLYKMSSAT